MSLNAHNTRRRKNNFSLRSVCLSVITRKAKNRCWWILWPDAIFQDNARGPATNRLGFWWRYAPCVLDVFLKLQQIMLSQSVLFAKWQHLSRQRFALSETFLFIYHTRWAATKKWRLSSGNFSKRARTDLSPYTSNNLLYISCHVLLLC